MLTSWFRKFPWLHSHGPIEASVRRIWRPWTRSDFRGYTATAPLKHQGTADRGLHGPDFRGYTATAPLKRCS